MTTMQAGIIRAHGGPEMLEVGEIERPEPGPGEILVRVAACALNHLDIFVRRGMPGVHLPLPHISGGDITGWVEAVADKSDAGLIGRQVLLDPLVGHHALGENLRGGLAEYVVAPAQNAIPVSGTLRDLIRYAALPIAYGTAHRMIFTRGNLRAGETMLVLAAAGGVGVACVQFGRQVGARVIACSSSDAKLARLRVLGAAETINTAREDFSKRTWELTGKQGADLVVDYNGQETWPGSIRCTRRGGRLVTCGATTGFEAVTDLRYVWTREIDIRGSDGWTRSDLDAIVGMVRDGALEPVIHAVFPLSRLREAEAVLEDRTVFGKVVVVPDAIWEEEIGPSGAL